MAIQETKTETRMLEKGISINVGTSFSSFLALASGEIIRRHFLQTDINPEYCLYLSALGIIAGVSLRRIYYLGSLHITKTSENVDVQELTRTVIENGRLIKELGRNEESQINSNPDYLELLISERNDAVARIREIRLGNKVDNKIPYDG